MTNQQPSPLPGPDSMFTDEQRQALGSEFDRRFPNPPLPADHPQVHYRPVKQSKDRAQYVRQQRGHSLTKHLLLGVFVLWIPAIYFSFSPNHYWHA